MQPDNMSELRFCYHSVPTKKSAEFGGDQTKKNIERNGGVTLAAA